jgi:hypothetical protein
MNDAPPPLVPPNPYTQAATPPPPPKSGCGKTGIGCGLGCLVALALLAVGAFFAVTATKKYIDRTIEQYTTLEAEPIEPPTASPEEIGAAVRKFEDFQRGMQEGGTPTALSVTGEEINLMLFNHPELEDLAGRVSVSIADDRLNARVALPLDLLPLPEGGFFSERLAGKFLNGEVGLSLKMLAGRPALYAESVSVNGLELPESFMAGLRSQNLLEEATNNPDAKDLFERIEELKVEGGRLLIVPKAPR